jgi:CBS-domain-containing membrane protein
MFYHKGFASDAVMSPGIFFCFEDQALEQALEQTQARRVRHLPVLNRQKRMTGPHLAE